MGAAVAKRSDSTNLAVVLLLVAGFAVVACGGVGFAVWLLARPTTPQAATLPVQKRVYERQEFKDAVLGKSQEEVKAMLGVPDSTEGIGGNASWLYKEICRDAVTGKTDWATPIQFSDGIATRVGF